MNSPNNPNNPDNPSQPSISHSSKSKSHNIKKPSQNVKIIKTRSNPAKTDTKSTNKTSKHRPNGGIGIGRSHIKQTSKYAKALSTATGKNGKNKLNTGDVSLRGSSTAAANLKSSKVLKNSKHTGKMKIITKKNLKSSLDRVNRKNNLNNPDNPNNPNDETGKGGDHKNKSASVQTRSNTDTDRDRERVSHEHTHAEAMLVTPVRPDTNNMPNHSYGEGSEHQNQNHIELTYTESKTAQKLKQLVTEILASDDEEGGEEGSEKLKSARLERGELVRRCSLYSFGPAPLVYDPETQTVEGVLLNTADTADDISNLSEGSESSPRDSSRSPRGLSLG